VHGKGRSFHTAGRPHPFYGTPVLHITLQYTRHAMHLIDGHWINRLQTAAVANFASVKNHAHCARIVVCKCPICCAVLAECHTVSTRQPIASTIRSFIPQSQVSLTLGALSLDFTLSYVGHCDRNFDSQTFRLLVLKLY